MGLYFVASDQRREAHAFTTLELVASIGVLVILAALLVSAVHSARRKARFAQCASNLRQHGVALQQFVQDHGVFPLQYNPGKKAGKFIDHSLSWMGSLFPQSVNDFDGYDNKGVFNCPAANRPNFRSDLAFADYGYNSDGLIGDAADVLLGLGGVGSKEERYAPPVPESAVASPARMLAIGDGFRGWSNILADGWASAGRIIGVSDNYQSTDRVKKRHSGNAAFAFVDAHVENIALSTLFHSTAEKDLSLWNRDGAPHHDRLQR